MSRFPAWSYALSGVHAAVQSWYTVPYTVEFMRCAFTECENDEVEPSLVYYKCMALFAAYIAFDSAMHWHTLGRAYQIHHTVTLVATWYNVAYGPHDLGLAVLTNEVSTVFLSTRALLPKGHSLRAPCFKAFVASFFVFRVLLNSLLLAYTLQLSIWCTLLMGSIWSVNVFWFAKAFAKALS